MTSSPFSPIGLGDFDARFPGDFLDLKDSDGGAWRVGVDGVLRILTPKDRKVEFVCFADKTMTWVKSAMGHPAMYPLEDAAFEGPAEAVLMDLDGTSVTSEEFWIWVIEQSTARLLGNPKFELEEEDLPHVSGHSVSEHLQYCIEKYCDAANNPTHNIEEARRHYFDITRYELAEISAGRGRDGAFKPVEGLKDFLHALKARDIKIGLVTSGLYEKAWPEIVSAFKTLDMGDPLEFYDAIISAGFSLTKGQTGTLGELAPKPHPWLYAETARVGLGVAPESRRRVIGLEDSSAGVVSIRLAGFAAIGVGGGNIAQSGVRPLLHSECETLADALPIILGD